MRVVLFSLALLVGCGVVEPAPEAAPALGTEESALCSKLDVLDYCANTSAPPCNALTDSLSCITGSSLPYPSDGHLLNPWIIRLYPNFPPGKPAQDAVWSTLSASPTFWSRMSSWGVGVGRNGGFHVLPDWLPPPDGTPEFISDCTLESSLNRSITQGQFPLPAGPFGDGTHGTTAILFVIYMPPFVCPSWFGGSTCPINAGYHSSFISGGQLYNYAIIAPTAAANGFTSIQNSEITSSHEVAEAATDFDIEDCPVPTGAAGCGWNNCQKQGEVADLCGGAENMAGFEVAQVLNQTNGICK